MNYWIFMMGVSGFSQIMEEKTSKTFMQYTPFFLIRQSVIKTFLLTLICIKYFFWTCKGFFFQFKRNF